MFTPWFWRDFVHERGTPALDITETPTHYVISCDLPGVCRKSLKVDYRETDGVLLISGERPQPKEESDKVVRRQERWYGKFVRAISLPKRHVKADEITASLTDGVLEVRIAKQSSSDGSLGNKSIPIAYNPTSKL